MTLPENTNHEDRIALAESIKADAQWEIGQTRTAQNQLLTAISLLGAAGGLVGTWATRNDVGGGAIGGVLIEVGTVLFGLAFLSIMSSSHPRGLNRRRLKNGNGVTGWPVLLQFAGATSDDALNVWLNHAATYRAEETIRDARTKARIAATKHAWLRTTVRLISVGFVVTFSGVRLWIGGI